MPNILGKCLNTPKIPITESSETWNQGTQPALIISGPAIPSNLWSGLSFFNAFISSHPKISPEGSPATITK